MAYFRTVLIHGKGHPWMGTTPMRVGNNTNRQAEALWTLSRGTAPLPVRKIPQFTANQALRIV